MRRRRERRGMEEEKEEEEMLEATPLPETTEGAAVEEVQPIVTAVQGRLEEEEIGGIVTTAQRVTKEQRQAPERVG